MLYHFVVDLREDLHTYTGGVPESEWRTDPAFEEFGNPEHLAYSAVQILCDYTGYWSDFERDHGDVLCTRRGYLNMPDCYMNCWDLYFQSVFHLLVQILLPSLQRRPDLYIDMYTFKDGVLFVTLSDEQGRKPAYMTVVEPPRE